MNKKITLISLQLLWLVCFAIPSYAHKINQSYLYLRVYESSLSGRFEIALKDLNKALGTSFGNEVTLEEIEQNLQVIKEYYIARTDFSSVYGDHEIQFEEPSLLRVGGQLGTFLILNFTLPDVKEMPEYLKVKYDVFFDKEEDHVGMLIIEYSWRAGIMNNESLPSMTYSKDRITGEVNLYEGSLFKGFLMMVREGVWHIWIGIDHILFLFALILPSVITRNKNFNIEHDKAWSVVVPQVLFNQERVYWTPVEKFKPAFLYIIKIVTFFTISHTITLGLAAFNIISLPSRLIESVIAISIAMAALHNIQPIFKGKEWVIAFVFGLFHGFGFASVLSELRSGEFLGLTLFGFNLGVELGQIAIIILIFPVLFAIRKYKAYNHLLVFGSFLLILISLYWFVERAFEYDILLGKYVIEFYRSLVG